MPNNVAVVNKSALKRPSRISFGTAGQSSSSSGSRNLRSRSNIVNSPW